MHKKLFLVLVSISILGGLLALSGCGEDPVKPTDPPRITSFTATPSDIMPGDSSLLAYAVTGADSVRLLPDGIRLSPTSSGSRWAKPATPTMYSLIGYNKGGRDSAALNVTMTGAVPVIATLTLSEDTLLVGDSAVLTWLTDRTDSIVIDGGTAHVADADSGGVVVKPSASRTYRAIAYNDIGQDTAVAALRIEVPYQINAINGLYYRGTIGEGIDEPPFSFQILDQAGLPLRRPWLHFSVTAGDGALSSDSALPNSGGIVSNDFLFTGSKGYGLIRAYVPDYDTLEVIARASVIRFGADGQGQYVRLYDSYADLVGLNGAPASVDYPEPGNSLYYVNYETRLGVVPIILDVDDDGSLEVEDPVVVVILNSVFEGTTPEGIGIGSPILAVRNTYGVPDNSFYSPASQTDPAAWCIQYYSLRADFYASIAGPDSAIMEIHLSDPTLKTPSVIPSGLNSRSTYRLPAGVPDLGFDH